MIRSGSDKLDGMEEPRLSDSIDGARGVGIVPQRCWKVELDPAFIGFGDSGLIHWDGVDGGLRPSLLIARRLKCP